jgi:hypothetical protein
VKVILSLLLALIPVAQLCVFQEQTKPEQKKQDSSVPIRDLLNAPAEVVHGNKTLTLTAFAWRDFSPVQMEPSGSPLMVALKITAAAKQTLPSGVQLDRAWVIFGEEVWEVSDLRNRIPRQDHAEESWIKCSYQSQCEITIRGGPKWGPGVDVIAVVRFTDDEGRHHFLQAPKHRVVETQ